VKGAFFSERKKRKDNEKGLFNTEWVHSPLRRKTRPVGYVSIAKGLTGNGLGALRDVDEKEDKLTEKPDFGGKKHQNGDTSCKRGKDHFLCMRSQRRVQIKEGDWQNKRNWSWTASHRERKGKQKKESFLKKR